MRQMLIFQKTQLDFFYPFPYITTKKYSVESYLDDSYFSSGGCSL